MEYNPNPEIHRKLEKNLKNEADEKILTPETMLMEYSRLKNIKNEYDSGNFSDFPNFSNWNNWPHSR